MSIKSNIFSQYALLKVKPQNDKPDFEKVVESRVHSAT